MSLFSLFLYPFNRKWDRDNGDQTMQYKNTLQPLKKKNEFNLVIENYLSLIKNSQ